MLSTFTDDKSITYTTVGSYKRLVLFIYNIKDNTFEIADNIKVSYLDRYGENIPQCLNAINIYANISNEPHFYSIYKVDDDIEKCIENRLMEIIIKEAHS